MAQDQAGYTLAELVVVMAIFTAVMTITSVSFNRIVSSSGQITRSSENNVEGMIGLELMRTDLENAGFGLPWSYPSGIHYTEAVPGAVVSGCSGTDPALYNDDSTPPRAVLCGDNVGYNGSDYLVVKGSSVATNRTCKKWSYLTYSSQKSVVKQSKAENELKLGTERVIVVKEGVRRGAFYKELKAAGSSKFFAQFLMDNSTDGLGPDFLPSQPGDKHVVYGIDLDTNPRMPYNRADFYLERPAASSEIASRCAPRTATLYKAVVNQGNGGQSKNPLLECVADMQVVYTIDQGTGPVHMTPEVAKPLLSTAQDVRDLVREMRVYLLAHEGKRDAGFSFVAARDPGDSCSGGDAVRVGGGGLGSCFRLSSLGSGWEHYRWKLYSIVVQPKNLN